MGFFAVNLICVEEKLNKQIFEQCVACVYFVIMAMIL